MPAEIRFARGTRKLPVGGACEFCEGPTDRELVWVLYGEQPLLVALHVESPGRDRAQAMAVCDRCFSLLVAAGRNSTLDRQAFAWAREPGALLVPCTPCNTPTPDRVYFPREQRFSALPFCDRCIQAVMNAASDAHSLLPALY